MKTCGLTHETLATVRSRFNRSTPVAGRRLFSLEQGECRLTMAAYDLVRLPGCSGRRHEPQNMFKINDIGQTRCH